MNNEGHFNSFTSSRVFEVAQIMEVKQDGHNLLFTYSQDTYQLMKIMDSIKLNKPFSAIRFMCLVSVVFVPIVATNLLPFLLKYTLELHTR